MLTSAADAEALFAEARVTPDRHAPRTHFRSIYGRLPSSGLPVELMGGLEVRSDDRWHSVRPATRVTIPIGDTTVFIPDRAELVEILRLFARPKDLARAALLC